MRMYLILFGLALTNFLANFDVNALNLALVWIEKDLSLSLIATEWIMNGFLLAFASVLLIAGRLSDLLGHKRLLLIGVALFGLSSTLAGFCEAGWQLVVCRIVQGVGTALFWPGTQSIIYLTFPHNKRVMALGILLTVSGIALSLGPVVSGLILTFFDWRWIFFINTPVSLFSFLVVYFAYHEKPQPYKNGSLDFLGLFYLLIFAFSFIYGITLFGQKHLEPLAIIAFLLLALIFVFVYIDHEKRTESPLIPLQLLRNKNFIKSVWLRGTLMFSFIAVIFLTAFYLQHFLLLAPWRCGLYFLPITLFFGLGSFVGSKLITKIPLIRMIYCGGILSTIGIFLLGILSPEYTKWGFFILPMVLFGIGFGTFAPLNNYYAMQTMPSSSVGFAISFSYMVGLILSSFSVSLGGVFITKLGMYKFSQQTELTPQIEDIASDILSGTEHISTLPHLIEPLQSAFFFSYQMDMFLCAFLIGVSFLVIRLKEIPSIDYNS